MFEAAFNIIISLILVNRLGTYGVLIGTAISLLLTFWIDPYIIYKKRLRKPLKNFVFLNFLIALWIILFTGLIYTIVKTFKLDNMNFILFTLLIIILASIASIVPIFISGEYSFYRGEILKIFRKIFHKK
ncbi:polysaccharide biosynthesis C-terminal domain-containing protein [Helcococcus bovis]|uniref:polysaccharide biosynthesis C-terminal domain-containing protein n=1 Tax=Helcococcus bovis TaxID=3153252 RepID=UPI0038BBC77B